MLALTRLSLVGHALAPTHLPTGHAFALHGMVGWALKAALCTCGLPLHAPDTPGSHRPDCRYQTAFRTLLEPDAAHAAGSGRDAPRPLLVRQPATASERLQPGEVFAFELVLVGLAHAFAADILDAVHRWAAFRGLGAPPQPFALLAVFDGLGQPLLDTPPYPNAPLGPTRTPAAEPLFSNDDDDEDDVPPLVPPLPPDALWRVTLHTRTPMVLRRRFPPTDRNARALPLDRLGYDLPLDLLLNAISQRLHQLTRLYAPPPPPPRHDPTLGSTRLAANRLAPAPFLFASGSTRQRSIVQAYAGSLTLERVPSPVLELLWAGQYLHAGSFIGFGHGQYDLDVERTA